MVRTGSRESGQTTSPYSSRASPAWANAVCSSCRTRAESRKPSATAIRATSKARGTQTAAAPTPSRREPGIPARHRQAVRLTGNRAANDLDTEVQIASHPAHHSQLLVIFLAKDGEMGLHGMKQLGHHCRDTAEVAWPLRAAESLGQLLDIHQDWRSRRRTSTARLERRQYPLPREPIVRNLAPSLEDRK